MSYEALLADLEELVGEVREDGAARLEKLLAKYDPNQPRANDGKWTDTGAGTAAHLKEHSFPPPSDGVKWLDVHMIDGVPVDQFGDPIPADQAAEFKVWYAAQEAADFPDEDLNDDEAQYTDEGSDVDGQLDYLRQQNQLGEAPHPAELERTAARKYLDELHGRSAALTKDEIDQLENYQDGGYGELNGHLRQDPKWRDDSLVRAAVLAKKAEVMDGLISSRPAIDRPIVTWRGAGSGRFASDLKVGDSFTDNGYVSMSTSPAIANRFVKPGNDGIASVFRTTLRAGTKGVWMNAATGDGSESELILGRGTNFRVTEIAVFNPEEYRARFGVDAPNYGKPVRVVYVDN